MNPPDSRPRLRGTTAASAAVLLALVAACAGPAAAVRARILSDSSWEEFRLGEAVGIAIGAEGSLRPGPEVSLLADPGVRSTWALAGDGRGGLVAGTGDGGQVIARGPGKDGKSTTRATLFDEEVFALAGDGRGNWYAAGAPVGTVVKIPQDGEPRTLFDVPEGVIFGLLARPDGTVYAGTGDRGRLYRISPSGEGRVLCESPDLTVRCLAWGADGKIIAGTDGRGLLETIDPESGTIRVLYEAEEREIVSVIPLADGSIVFGANPGPPVESSGDPDPAEDPAAVEGADHDPRGGKSGSGGGTKPSVYLCSPDGSVRRTWNCPEKMLHSLAIGPDGAIYAATSGDAAVYRLGSDGSVTLWWKAEEQQVLSLCLEGSNLFAGTGNPGRLYQLGPGRADAGTFTGKVFDAGDLARWGHFRWNGELGGGSVGVETRSGFTDRPDDSWSKWTPVNLEGSDGPVTSPAGRYLQWKVTLHPGTEGYPSVRRVDVAALGSNRPPLLTSLRLSADEPAFASSDPSRGGVTQLMPGGVQVDYSLPGVGGISVPAEDVPAWIRRIRSVTWEATDPDGDDLRYTVEIRDVGREGYRVLTRDLAERAWSLDQGLLPDGVYELRVTASDAPGNPVGVALLDRRLSPPFRIDTEAPRVVEVKAARGEGRTIEVRGAATDEASPLRRIEVSVDGDPFRTLAADDGLLDSKHETFQGRIPLRPEQEGSWIVVRAQDAAGNRGSYRAWLEDTKTPAGR